MPLRAKTKTACEIARVDPQRINEWVSKGVYTCAPETSARSARIFEQDDIVALRIIGILSKHIAGTGEKMCDIACMVRDEIRAIPEADFITIAISPNGMVSVTDGMLASDMVVSGATYHPMRMVFDIAGMRREIQAHLEYEADNRVVGED